MRAFAGLLLLLPFSAGLLAADKPALESGAVRVEVNPADGSARLFDKRTGAEWDLGVPRLVMKDKSTQPVRIAGGVASRGGTLSYRTDKGMQFQFKLAANPPAVDYSFDAPAADVSEVRLLDKALTIGPGPDSYFAIPNRMGILMPVEGDKPYSRLFSSYCANYNGSGYSMAMAGAVSKGSALLATWDNPYTAITVDYAVEPQRRLAMSLGLQGAARSVRLQPLGRGGYVEVAKAYRPIARQRGYLKTLAEKLKENPDVARFFGAPDFKLSVLSRSNRTGKETVRIGYTFEETADVAEHLAKDLGIDRALFVLSGWINAGYDNKHPDILPAAPEAGGNEGLAAASRRIHALGKGWVFGLHDNYQDFYKDAPSWNPDYIMKNADGSLHAGGVWAGGQSYTICSRRAVDLASRPQNVPAVKRLFDPGVYFADTIFAVPLYECFDPKHPLTLADDIHYKQLLCDYLRKEVGLFGSEEGMEWGVAHADYFEGLVSHKTGGQTPAALANDIVIPMFEIVYGDAISMYAYQSDRARVDNPSYILDHVLYAEMPLYQLGGHRYWTDTAPAQGGRGQPLQPSRMVFAQGGRLNPTDQFIKNTYEVLSPLGRSTALEPMTDHRFVTPDRKVESTRFGSDANITVNFGEADYATARAVLPQWGFLIESPALTAFYARSYGAVKYAEPALFVIRSMDGKPLSSSSRVRIYHGFGGNRVEFRGKVIEVDTEKFVP
ncbi:MAG: DUF5696 domain-containing protein [Bryobacteraceae bacterium]|jgi:hypothetical protein